MAIFVKNISKTFRIPHEKVASLRGAFVSMFHKKTFETFQALDAVSFEVKKGEFFGIIGRNGSGKSTLLKILAGIYQPDKGSVRVNGMISPFLELGIGFNPELSGRDNVYLNATVLGMTRKQIDHKFNDIVAFSELERFIDQKLKNYSSGMQVRLAFSVSIHANRDILLMDEVLAVGDTNFQSKCLSEFAKYRDSGRTVVLVTHDTAIVERYCDRAMLLRSGNVQIVGKPKDVCSRYREQNMTDEEKRLQMEEEIKKKQEARDFARRVKKEKRESQKAKRKQVKLASQDKNTEVKRVFLNKKAQVNSVITLNEKSEEKKVFSTGEVITIRVTMELFSDLQNPIFGIIIRNADAKTIFVTNTNFQNIKTGVLKKGLLQVDYRVENYFCGGMYTISPAIASENARFYYDWRDEMTVFKIMDQEYTSGGMVEFKHAITIKEI